ncbi:MAG: dienelactone hydrolase [Acidimicrobiia bacterium]|nr:dienelactone hydrolase [Acidimicrobiia bacterium]
MTAVPGKRIRGKAKGLVLFHGAGGDRDHHTFVRLEQVLPVPVARINFPYRRKGPGRRPPDRMPKLIESVNEAVAEWAKIWRVRTTSIVVGGRSMGGRAASMAVAEGMRTAGLMLLNYPLHPPGQPDKLRVEHLEHITCPTLLIQGRRDPFGTPAEFARHLPSISGPLTEHWIDANHSPNESLDGDIVGLVGTWLKSL